MRYPATTAPGASSLIVGCISEPGGLGNRAEPSRPALRMPRRGPEQTPRGTPLLIGRHLLPAARSGLAGPLGERGFILRGSPRLASTSPATATPTRTRSPPPSATPS